MSKSLNMPPLKSSLLFLFFTISLSKLFACGNEYYEVQKTVPNKNSKLDIVALFRSKGDFVPYWTNGFLWDGADDGRWTFPEKFREAGIKLDNEWEINWVDIQTALDKKVDYKMLSDYAWNEVKFGDRENAVRLLEILNKEHPGEYNIVANLGTAYEVIGKNKEALALLRKAVAINPQSHYGSEWIHIKILEQKVAKSPDYRQILDLKADNNYTDWLAGKVYNKELKPDSLMVQLAYQLHERIGFVKAPDPIVGQLVKDFGDLVALTHSKTEAIQFYNYAIGYDSSVIISADERKNIVPVTDEARKEETVSTEKKKSGKLIYIVAGVLVLGGLIYFVTQRKKTTG